MMKKGGKQISGVADKPTAATAVPKYLPINIVSACNYVKTQQAQVEKTQAGQSICCFVPVLPQATGIYLCCNKSCMIFN